MSQCVPSWDLDGHPTPPNSFAPDNVILRSGGANMGKWATIHPWFRPSAGAYEIADDGSRFLPTNYTWEKPRAGGTLESIVGQATSFPQGKTGAADSGGGNELVPWFDHRRRAAPSDTATVSMDALVPCSTTAQEEASTDLHSSTCVMDGSTRVESFSAAANTVDGRVARAPATAAVAAREWSSRDNNSVSGSAQLGRDSRQFTLDSCEREFSVGGFTSTSMGSPENNISGKEGTKVTATDDHDSVCHSRPQMEAGEEEDKKRLARKVSTPTKKKRAAAIHNQSERKRRDKINQRIKTLQKMIPNSTKTDKASILDEVIQYLKQLKAQVQMMSTMSMPYMMLPMALQQQFRQLSMMGMGMGMGMGWGRGVMDMNNIGRPNIAGIHLVLHPSSAFMPLPFWDGSGSDHLTASASEMPDPSSTFLACQSQPMTTEACSRMAALYQQQLDQPPPSYSKNP